MIRTFVIAVLVLAPCACEAQAQARTRAATEAAEWLFARYGTKAGRSAPELASRIERMAVQHGDEAIVAIRRGGPAACGLVEAAGADGPKVLRVLAAHGEEGAARVLSRPTAMQQYLQFGDGAATALVRHPGVAEPLVERAGAQAVKALGCVDPRNGRRLAMMLDGELAQVGRHPEVLGVVAGHGGDRVVNFLWQNKATLAGGAALTAFLANPEPYLNGTKNLTEAAGEAVVKPVVGGVVSLVNGALICLGVLIVALAFVVHKHGLPGPEVFKTAFTLFKK